MVLRRRYVWSLILAEQHLTTYQILAITCDNASNNTTMVADLEMQLEGAARPETRVRCFAHILNLVVKICSITPTLLRPNLHHLQAIISGFSHKRKANSAQDNQEAELIALESEPLPDDFDYSADESTSNESDDEDTDLDREASDAEVIADIIHDVESEHSLTGEKEQFGRYTVIKVCSRLLGLWMILTHICSLSSLLSEPFICRQFVQTLSHAASRRR